MAKADDDFHFECLPIDLSYGNNDPTIWQQETPLTERAFLGYSKEWC